MLTHGFTTILVMLVLVAPAAGQLKTITMGYPSLAFTQSHIWVAKEQGLFRKYGLEVDPVFLRGGQVPPRRSPLVNRPSSRSELFSNEVTENSK